MSAAFQPVADPSRDLRLESARGRDRAVTRYLFFAGNLIDPDRERELEHLAGGGEEIETNCLRRTVGGFVPRAVLIPLEQWAKGYPAEHVSEGAESTAVHIVSPSNLELETGAAGAGMARRPGFLYGKPTLSVPFYPGDELPGILQQHGQKGLVEVAALRGEEWYTPEGRAGTAQVLTADFFGDVVRADGTVLRAPRPASLRALRAMIETGAAQSALHAAAARAMLQSCDIFRRYAERLLSEIHLLLKKGTSPNGQYTYTYSNVHRALLTQLEMEPQDVENSALTQQMLARLAEQQQGTPVTPELIAAIASAIAKEFAAEKPPAPPAPPSGTAKSDAPKSDAPAGGAPKGGTKGNN